MAATRHNDFSFASSFLTTVLLASLGEANEDTLHTTFPDLAPYMLDPRQIVDTMLAKHGVSTGDNVSKLLTSLSQPLTSLSDLTKHMSTFLLASQRLTRSRQGETAYNYFKLFLETVSGFPSIGMCLTTYYSAYPTIINQSLVGHAFSSPGKHEALSVQVRPRNTLFRLSATWGHQVATPQQQEQGQHQGKQANGPGKPTHSGTHPSLEHSTWSHPTRSHPGTRTRHHLGLCTIRR
jgi:hypothetical protein